MMKRGRLLLGSQSPRRRELLKLLGLPFNVTTPDVTEAPRSDEPPHALAARLARAKARTVAEDAPSAGEIVIGCDTVVALEGQVLGKPSGAEEATRMLRRLRGRSHTVYSGLSLEEAGNGQNVTTTVKTHVVMRDYTEEELAAYVASGDPLDKAGAYAIQHPGFHPVARIEGCYANVMGLPLCHLTQALRAWGVEPRADVPANCQHHNQTNCPFYDHILSEPMRYR